MKRVTMGGTDPVVTDDGIAALILEYAQHLGRIGITDSITVPSLLEGESVEADMLLGPASQITVTPDRSAADDRIDPRRIEAAVADLGRRIDEVTGSQAKKVPAAEESFVDFARYDRGDE